MQPRSDAVKCVVTALRVVGPALVTHMHGQALSSGRICMLCGMSAGLSHAVLKQAVAMTLYVCVTHHIKLQIQQAAGMQR